MADVKTVFKKKTLVREMLYMSRMFFFFFFFLNHSSKNVSQTEISTEYLYGFFFLVYIFLSDLCSEVGTLKV